MNNGNDVNIVYITARLSDSIASEIRRHNLLHGDTQAAKSILAHPEIYDPTILSCNAPTAVLVLRETQAGSGQRFSSGESSGGGDCCTAGAV